MSAPPTFAEAARTWLKVGLLSFGGPAGQIAVMHRLIVDEKGWVPEDRFLRALNYCMLLPGPEAQQLATYLGWLLHGTRGGLVAGGLFVLPGALFMGVLCAIYAAFHQLPLFAGALYGVKAAVVAIVAQALLRVGKRALSGRATRGVAVLAFAVLALDLLPFPAVVLGAGLLGASRPEIFAPKVAEAPALSSRPRLSRTLGVLALGLGLWWAPVLAAQAWLGPDHVLTRLGRFFAEAAVVTFGGAYAVLAWMADHVVQDQGWLTAGQMMDGLGLAETTPGPLILVVQFVGFLAAYQQPDPFSPWGAGLLASALVLWVTFCPSFLWIFLGAPYVEALSGARRLQGALGAITASVVGVIANLSLWFALHVVFRTVGELALGPARLPVPVWRSLDPAALLLTAGALIAVFRYKLGMVGLLAGASVLGVLAHLGGLLP